MSRAALASAFMALCVACAPVLAQAQTPDRKYRVGVLEYASPEPGSPVRTWIVERLRAFGYVEGRNLVLDMRSLRGLDSNAQDGVVADLVRQGPDVIVVGGTGIAVACGEGHAKHPHRDAGECRSGRGRARSKS